MMKSYHIQCLKCNSNHLFYREEKNIGLSYLLFSKNIELSAALLYNDFT